jgi:adenylylsulfate kinase
MQRPVSKVRVQSLLDRTRPATAPSAERLHLVVTGRVDRGRLSERDRLPRTTAMAPSVIWFTGLSGAGKSTIAREVCERLQSDGVKVEYLDGDVIRSLLPATGFSRRERDEHVKRVGFLASRLEHHGVVVVCALISPYAESRAYVRELCQRFIEIHVATPLEECERRDVKGLYRRARRGEIAHFTGIDDAYEPPVDPELRLDTRGMTVDDAVQLVMEALPVGCAPSAADAFESAVQEVRA